MYLKLFLTVCFINNAVYIIVCIKTSYRKQEDQLQRNMLMYYLKHSAVKRYQKHMLKIMKLKHNIFYIVINLVIVLAIYNIKHVLSSTMECY